MDALIAELRGTRDQDLVLCPEYGIAYQHDMGAGRASYDDRYLDKFAAYDRGIERAVNAGRCAMLARHLVPASMLLDIGAGDGAFVRAAREAGFQAMGYEVIPSAVYSLKLAELYDNHPRGYDALTFWDVLEHLEDPGSWLTSITKPGAMLFVSVPIFEDLRNIRYSKHYRPGEHLYYWTAAGLIAWLAMYGFAYVERSDHETAAGRESIGAFAFRRMN